MAPVVWGHASAPADSVQKTFASDWTLSNAAASGAGDEEILTLNCATSEATLAAPHYLGAMEAYIKLNTFRPGSGGVVPLVYYKTGATPPACVADVWHLYNGVSFACLGFVLLRLVKVE